jgi:hypothetical protein
LGLLAAILDWRAVVVVHHEALCSQFGAAPA